jgi:WD40 repeat protein
MVGIQDNRVLLYDAKLGTERLAYSKHTAIPSCGNFSTDGALIVTGAINGEVMVWYSATGLDRVAIQGMSGAVLNASMSSDNTAILTHDDRMIIMWDIRSGFPLMNIPVEGSPVLRTPKDLMKPDSPKNRDKNAVRYLAAVFIAGNNIMISKTNRRVSVLDPNTGEEELMLATRAHVHCIHSGNKIVAMGDVNGNLYLLHLKL